MSDKSKIENEVEELKNLLNDAEDRLRQLESDQAAMKSHRGKGLFKHVKKVLIAAAVLLVVVKGGKVLAHRRCKKNALS